MNELSKYLYKDLINIINDYNKPLPFLNELINYKLNRKYMLLDYINNNKVEFLICRNESGKFIIINHLINNIEVDFINNFML